MGCGGLNWCKCQGLVLGQAEWWCCWGCGDRWGVIGGMNVVVQAGMNQGRCVCVCGGGVLGIGWGEMRLVQGGQVRVSGVVRMVRGWSMGWMSLG